MDASAFFFLFSYMLSRKERLCRRREFFSSLMLTFLVRMGSPILAQCFGKQAHSPGTHIAAPIFRAFSSPHRSSPRRWAKAIAAPEPRPVTYAR